MTIRASAQPSRSPDAELLRRLDPAVGSPPDFRWKGARSLDSLRRIGPARASPSPHRTTPKFWTPRIPTPCRP
jgi:hypothetical protein